ncbi:MAG: nucleotidyltransferase domain-containing protein [archaeon]|nr:nucleotidyltransferase domain-containing protein [archaeon]
MLEIFNELEPFFEDCYREISVREYSRIMKISAPTASTLLKLYKKEGLLKKREDRRYLLFRVDRENGVLLDLSRIYWKMKLSSLVETIKEKMHNPTIILFGSLSKLESKQDSDIDLAIISKVAKEIDLDIFEKELKRKIQPFYFKSFKEISANLRLNILKGYFLIGEVE